MCIFKCQSVINNFLLEVKTDKCSKTVLFLIDFAVIFVDDFNSSNCVPFLSYEL